MKSENYTEQVKRLPKTGKQVIAQTEGSDIIVYQAYNSQIASYAVQHQKFGGAHYSFNRMSWIKPGFLWMMYRAGWAVKENQERILAIHIPLEYFKAILNEATVSSYGQGVFESQDEWKQELNKTEVRLQWDPDHDPYGNKQERKAIQLGMKGDMLKKFCTEWITKIEDITEFVKTEHIKVKNNDLDSLQVPLEEIIIINDLALVKRLGITN